jgi:hypothetical protein
MCEIKIIGPGLVVNGPGVVIRNALVAAGYQVQLAEWIGLDQWPGTWEERQKIAAQLQRGMKVELIVDPLPWGG